MFYTSSRELFEAAREAAIDASRCETKLARLESSATGVLSPSFEAHVHGGRKKGLDDRLVAILDNGETLRQRIEQDERIVKTASRVLFGDDGEGGLCRLVPALWADVIMWYYLCAESMETTASILGCSARRCFTFTQAAFDVADANGFNATRLGIGTAEDD